MSVADESLAAYRKQKFDAEKQKNRDAAPNLAALVDEYREQFPGLKLIWGRDNITGVEIGVKEEVDESKVFTIPADYFPCQAVSKKWRKK